jgi:TPR repeat protein
VKWYRKAADQGDAVAQFNLGYMYAYGRGVAKDEAEAVKWYRKAADQGRANAQNGLGVMYAKGQGVPKDETEAYKWFLLSGAQGDETARKNYARLERTLTSTQRAEGQRLAREFRPRPSKLGEGNESP